MNNYPNPTIFGEVLFDCFPDGAKALGGAPFNVAWHLHAFGDSPQLVTRIGEDAPGKEIVQSMQNWGMQTSHIQYDPDHPTGRVDVSIVENEPSYQIVENCAYDFIAPLKNELNSNGILYHGTLALRNNASRNTLLSLIQSTNGSIFLDVNLRPPYWQKDEVLQYMQHARWVKLNQEELEILADNSAELHDKMRHLHKQCNLELLIVTLGADGAVILDNKGTFYQEKPPKPNNFVDTVGAGDAFTALFMHGLIHNNDLEVRLKSALRFASHVVGLQGATTSKQNFYSDIIQRIG